MPTNGTNVPCEAAFQKAIVQQRDDSAVSVPSGTKISVLLFNLQR